MTAIDDTTPRAAPLSSAVSSEVARLATPSEQADDVTTTFEAIEGHPASVIVDAAQNADLLVVGSRGHGGLVGALLGSVSQHVMAHAQCPVVAVRAPHEVNGMRQHETANPYPRAWRERADPSWFPEEGPPRSR